MDSQKATPSNDSINVSHLNTHEILDLDNHSMVIGISAEDRTEYMKILLDELEKKDGSIVLLDPRGDLADYARGKSKKNKILLGVRELNENTSTYSGINVFNFAGMEYWIRLALEWLSEFYVTDEIISDGTTEKRRTLYWVFFHLLPYYLENSPSDTNISAFVGFLSDYDSVLRMLDKPTMPSFEMADIKESIQTEEGYKELVRETLNRLKPLLNNINFTSAISPDRRNEIEVKDFLEGPDNLLIPEISERLLGLDGVRIIVSLILAQIMFRRKFRDKNKERLYVVINEAQIISPKILHELLSMSDIRNVVFIIAFRSPYFGDNKFKEYILPYFYSIVCFKVLWNDGSFFSHRLSLPAGKSVSKIDLYEQEKGKAYKFFRINSHEESYVKIELRFVTNVQPKG